MIEKGCELMWLEEENGKQFTLIVILSARLPKSRTEDRLDNVGYGNYYKISTRDHICYISIYVLLKMQYDIA